LYVSERDMLSTSRKLATAIALTWLLHSSANGTENGLISYPVGVNTVLNGVLPPPGATQFYNYTLYYNANKFAGSSGDSLIPAFHLNTFADAPRPIHPWGTMFGPFTLSSGAIVPFIYLHVSADVKLTHPPK